jgi:hypothetical protein
MIGVSRDAVDLERALAACAQHLQQARASIVAIPLALYAETYERCCRGVLCV